MLIVVLAFWLYYERIAFAEEEFLRRAFGDEFERWAARTPAFVPRVRNWRASDPPFSLRNILKSEYSGLLAVVMLSALLDVVSNLVATGRPVLDRFARAVFFRGLAVCLILLVLKRKTRLLHVKGR